MVGGGDLFYLKFRVNRPTLKRNRWFYTDIRSCASTVTSSEKSSINTNRKSITRFPMSLRWSSYVASNFPKGELKKDKTAFFSCKIALRLKKVSLCENYQRQSCKAFIGRTMRAKMIGGNVPFCLKISPILTHHLSKTQNDSQCKMALRVKKVCYKVSLCENYQRQSCMAFIGLTITARMVGGGRPLLPENWPILTHPLSIFYLFSPVANQP